MSITCRSNMSILPSSGYDFNTAQSGNQQSRQNPVKRIKVPQQQYNISPFSQTCTLYQIHIPLVIIIFSYSYTSFHIHCVFFPHNWHIDAFLIILIVLGHGAYRRILHGCPFNTLDQGRGNLFSHGIQPIVAIPLHALSVLHVY